MAPSSARSDFLAEFQRVQFDRPISGFQLTQTKLADMASEFRKGTLPAIHLGRLTDAGNITAGHK